MLIRASTIIGLPVFTIADGKKIVIIQDVIYHPKLNKIEALLVEKGGWFSDSKVIVFSEIRSIGEDAILIDSVDVLKKASNVERDIEYIAKSDTYLTGTKIITEDGLELGEVSDIYFDTRTGDVEEFEVTHKAAKDLKSGKKRVKISDIITVGDDVAIVKVYTKTEGLSATKSDKKEQPLQMPKIQHAEEEMKEHTQGREDHDGPSANPRARAKDVKSKISDRRKKDAVGLYLTKNILTLDDRLLAKEGDMVTNKLLEEAEGAGVIEQVLDNVSQRIPLSA